MLNWSYKEAYAFFTENAYGRVIPESKEYVTSLNSSSTIDLRGKENARELILESIDSRTFILIDGGSLQGKSTLANRIAKQTNAIVLDIDLLCRDWVDERLKKVQSQDEYMKIMLSLGKLTNKFIQDELENIVCQKSKLGRPVILVGRYLEVLYRAIIARTLGKYFEKTMSLLCCENNFKIIEQHMAKREKEFSMVTPDIMRQQIIIEYKNTIDFINQCNGNFLGVGMTTSFIVNIVFTKL